ncbi:circadian clock KaiB family protein [Phenylobacterium sp.]|jgi:circadian clock protein KaiB|uniref:circadian clock KaiB family protein n=1 Tax=Phenylobacterium sp. TaxID=1871053 RepID=UPI002F95CF65
MSPARKAMKVAAATAESLGNAAVGADGVYHFRLYVAGQTPKSMAAIENLTTLCDTHLPGRHRIEVLDLVLNPELAAQDQIMAIPTLVRSLPPPLKRMIGTLSDPERFLIGLDYSRPAT